MTHSRRAASLVELLVVMSACTVVLTLSSVVLVRAMRLQMISRDHCDAERNSLRLARQFRDDVHRAQSAAAGRTDSEEDAFLHLTMADGARVEYFRRAGTVLRQASTTTHRIAREEFAFPVACRLSVQELTSPPRVALTISSAPDSAGAQHREARPSDVRIPVSLHVEAALGRDLQFAPADEGETTP